MNDKGFAVVGSAVIIALAVFMGFGATVIVQRDHMLHQARLTQQRISRSAHEGLTVSVNRGSDSTDITITNDGSSTVVFNHLLLRQPGYGVVVVPSDDEFFNDLAGWWRFSEGAGDTAYDYSGNGNDGTLYGDPTWVDGWMGDGALKFDGSGDYILIPSSNSLNVSQGGNESFTLTWRERPESQFVSAILEWNDGSWNTHVWHYNDYDELFMNSDATPSWRVNNFYTSTGKRYFPAIVFNGSTIDVFKDGNHVSSFSRGPYKTTGDLYIGHRPGDLRFINATIDEVRIYDRALSPGEISELSKYNVLLYPVSLTPLESYTVTYPFQVDNQATVGVYTQLGNIFWEEVL